MSPVTPVSGITTQSIVQAPFQATAMPAGGTASFASLLAQGLHAVQAKVEHADALVKAFALDDNIPVHQVTYALEEAKLSVELAMQVRTRLLEGYRELMNMQL